MKQKPVLIRTTAVQSDEIDFTKCRSLWYILSPSIGRKIMWKAFSCLVLALLVSGCAPEKPTVRTISSITDIQGKWKVVEITDPDGNGFEPDGNLVMVIEGDKATSDGQPLRLELAADNSYVRLFATTNGIETNVGEVVVELTIETNPVQMVWMDRVKTKQVSLFQKEQ